ncbi:hypothetical protein C0991_000761 [Blastosporella zonata]|nr:hypothetical protein C0991_000761 [Blastosporella zonata]
MAPTGDTAYEPTMDELERELPMVMDGQIPLGDLLSRVMQAIYAELAELAETMPNMSDSARKRTLADWVVKTKKQVVKMYAVAKWARDTEIVQKCMNITAFLMTQNHQFEGAMEGLKYARESLDPARSRFAQTVLRHPDAHYAQTEEPRPSDVSGRFDNWLLLEASNLYHGVHSFDSSLLNFLSMWLEIDHTYNPLDGFTDSANPRRHGGCRSVSVTGL